MAKRLKPNTPVEYQQFCILKIPPLSENEFQGRQEYFSSQQKAEQYVAILIAEYLDELHGDKVHAHLETTRVPDSLRHDYDGLKKLVTTLGLHTSHPFDTFCNGIQFICEILDLPLLPYIIPAPARRFEFDEICAIFDEFGHARDSWNSGMDCDRAEAANFVATFEAMLQYQNWLQQVGEDIQGFNIRKALDQTRSFLPKIATNPEQLDKPTEMFRCMYASMWEDDYPGENREAILTRVQEKWDHLSDDDKQQYQKFDQIELKLESAQQKVGNDPSLSVPEPASALQPPKMPKIDHLVGQCYQCGQECNPCSQKCGPCFQLGEPVVIPSHVVVHAPIE